MSIVTTMDYLNKPDKRKKKTSLFQYKQYLKALEEDEIFRTGFIPPGYDANYLCLKWKELADKLNEDDKGPKLSAEEWKKRLMDWKHTTRAKERRINEGNTHLRMTPLEIRFMELWGCVPTIINISSVKPENSPSDIKVEKCNDTEKAMFEEVLDQSDAKQELESISSHEIQLLTSTPQLTLTSTPSNSEIKVVEQIQIPVPEKKIQNSNEEEQQNVTVTNDALEKKSEKLCLAAPPPLKRLRVNNVSQTHITQIPISIANTNDYNESNNLTSSANTTMIGTSTPIPTQINTTKENLQILTQALTGTSQTASLPTTSEIAYTINTIPQESDAIPVIDVQSIASQIKRLADIKEQKLRFEIEKFKFKNPGFKYDF